MRHPTQKAQKVRHLAGVRPEAPSAGVVGDCPSERPDPPVGVLAVPLSLLAHDVDRRGWLDRHVDGPIALEQHEVDMGPPFAAP